jgi:opacity protein-like surface antigen
MKHLPYVCLLALGSASALAASGPSSLFANNVELSYVQESTSGVSGHQNGWDLSATAYLGKSDFFVNALTSVGGDLGNGSDTASLGYRFKNVASLADVAVTVGSNESYGVALHRALGAGFGAWASYDRVSNGHDVNATVSKSLTHDLSADLGYTWVSRNGQASSHAWSLGVRYKF